MNYRVTRKKPFYSSLRVPPDKSISHRVLILSSLAEGTSTVENLLESQDVLTTVKVLKNLGKSVEKEEKIWVIKESGWSEPEDVLNAENSGTTARLIMGILSYLPFFSVITGDNSLRRRPMDRVVMPLTLMGGKFWARKDRYLPVAIKGSRLHAINYTLPIPSAQVKSSIILAALSVSETSTIVEPIPSRDHTERMVEYMGGSIRREGKNIIVSGKTKLKSRDFNIPGDFSSAAFFMALAALIEGSSLTIEDVGLNPTRTGFLEVLKKMGVRIEVELKEKDWEPRGSIKIEGGELSSIILKKEDIPGVIDEVPLIALLATQAKGESRIEGAEELRIKESDRICNTVENLRLMGAEIEELPDGLIVRGPTMLKGAKVKSGGDHRIAMMLSIAGSIADGETVIENSECVSISFPQFFTLLEKI